MGRNRRHSALVFAAVLFFISGPAASKPSIRDWERLEPGLELGTFAAPNIRPDGDPLIRILRIDPDLFEFRLLNASATEQQRSLTARDWCLENALSAAINASMYQKDYRTSVSLMRAESHVNNPRLSKDMAILAFDRLSEDVPPVKIIDRECEDLDEWGSRYGTLVQSIRMVSCRGRNVWQPQDRKWSTAAIGIDSRGHVLFIHVRAPHSPHDLINILSGLPIDLERAMYAEGGPEAQLYIRSGNREHEFYGSFESGFNENDDNPSAWPVPNVVGIVRRSETGDDSGRDEKS